MRIAIIGGGAAGFFAAIHAKENYPESEVVIFEKSQKLLSKVKVSGGGRCNVTNGCSSVSELIQGYPRGGKKLKKPFQLFNTSHTRQWFESRGVPLKTEPDGRVFPQSDNSQSIINCLLQEVKTHGINIKTGTGIESIEAIHDGLRLHFGKGNYSDYNKVIVASGGSPKRQGFKWLEDLGHKIVDPVPSLFTFNMPNEEVKQFMGLVVEETIVSIQGTKLTASGPLLITHWGMSGPAILKLSAFGARILSELNYDFKVQVNWVNEKNFDLVQSQVSKVQREYPNKLMQNINPFPMPERLWLFLLAKCEIPLDKKCGELGKKGMNKLINVLANDVYHVQGKTTFKEEFVTCGGVSLEDVDLKTMQSKVCAGLYFAGEVLDIDAITGGYNFQNAWTTGFIAGQLK